MKKKSLKNLKQTDGKLYNKHGVKSIDELLGIRHSPYKEKTVDDYESNLKLMNKAELQAHAVELGVVPREERDILIKSLLRQYLIAEARNNAGPGTEQQIKVKNEKELLKLLK